MGCWLAQMMTGVDSKWKTTDGGSRKNKMTGVGSKWKTTDGEMKCVDDRTTGYGRRLKGRQLMLPTTTMCNYVGVVISRGQW